MSVAKKGEGIPENPRGHTHELALKFSELGQELVRFGLMETYQKLELAERHLGRESERQIVSEDKRQKESGLIVWFQPANSPGKLAADGPWGRYLVKRRGVGERWFVVLLNGKSTSYGGVTADEAVASAERVIRANWPNYQPSLK